ncbi:hypothetical protein [Patulibacter sp.]|uniref:hypothetical protein n=1 Tax=Patulibacter sp. TaxID=1912859 RepID=UPI00271D9041|nr:hypothetical protein [Patulibacter sp.]MDO9407088.1 hypothetical protein [Patulibacter sp.]
MAPPSVTAPARDRVDIRPTALLLRAAVERHGVDATCSRFRLCRRRLGAVVAMRTTRGQHAHFLERGSVEDIVTHGPETFAVLHVPLAGTLQARLGDLLVERGPDALARDLGIDLPRAPRFVEQITMGRAGNGARVTHVCATIAEAVGIDPADLEDHAIERGWCSCCTEHVLVAGDRRCPWCDTAVILDERETADGHRVPHAPADRHRVLTG